ncbi:MAG: hypothetical protein M3Q69_14105 [Acidobacteriota bacterium]|nr:hypothetical protein [Acidobacteriota bacterium]
MRTRLLLPLLLTIACASLIPANALRELFGVRIGMSKAATHEKLSANGTMVREERKRQEAWQLRDERYEGAIVGYDREWRVRFITAVVRNDAHVRYADVLDVAAAKHQSTGTSHTYTWRPPHARYSIIAIGTDADTVKYVTLTRGADEEEEEEE